MAEEKFDNITNLDDMSVLRVLMHTIRGISPVSSSDFIAVPITDDSELQYSGE